MIDVVFIDILRIISFFSKSISVLFVYLHLLLSVYFQISPQWQHSLFTYFFNQLRGMFTLYSLIYCQCMQRRIIDYLLISLVVSHLLTQHFRVVSPLSTLEHPFGAEVVIIELRNDDFFDALSEAYIELLFASTSMI